MTNKKLFIYNHDNKINVFDRIIEDLDPKEIPSEFIDYVLVHFHDGSTVSIGGDIVDIPIPERETNPNTNRIKTILKNVKSIKVFIKTDKLEKEVNKKLNKIFKKKKTNS